MRTVACLKLTHYPVEPVVVFIERRPFDIRVGSVPAQGEETFHLTRALTSDQHSVLIFVHPELGEDLASGTFQIHQGAYLLVKVPKR